MFQKAILFVAIAFAFLPCAVLQAQVTDWMTAPSYYTHDPKTCQRVDQYSPDPMVVHTPRATTSIYHHVRSAIQVGDSIDIYHRVTRTGDIVRPYGEWRFPYRPFGVPYSQWGPNFGAYPGQYLAPFGQGFPPVNQGLHYGPFGPAGVINGSGWPQPWTDGYHPDIIRNRRPPQPFPNPQTNINQNVQGNDNQVIAN